MMKVMKGMKIKIFHVCPNFYPVRGGIESFVLESSRELVKKGYDITVVTSNSVPNTEKELAANEKLDGITIRRFPFKKFSRYNTSIEALKFILTSDFDILHVHGIGFFSDAMPLVKFKNNKKVVLSTHGGIFHTKTMMPLKNIYFNSMGKIAGKFSDKIIAVSDQDKKFMQKITDKRKIVRIGNGIYWKKFSKIKRHVNEVGSGGNLIFIGRIAKNKRIDRALNVIKKIKESFPSVRFFVVGDDWGEKSNLMHLAKKYGIKENVIFTGGVTEKKLTSYLSKSDIFLLPSEYEGFGISALVAMAAGLPVVANKIDTMKELINDGKNGFLVNYENREEVAKVLKKLLMGKKLRVKIGERARIDSKIYDWKNIVGMLEKTYKEVLK